MPSAFGHFLRSLRRAAGALATALREEHNFRRLAVGFALVLLGGWWVRLEPLEFAVLIAAGSAVVALELVNSAVERVVDIAQPRVNHYAAAIKNLMAAAVLTAALAALAVTLVIFRPYLVIR